MERKNEIDIVLILITTIKFYDVIFEKKRQTDENDENKNKEVNNGKSRGKNFITLYMST